VNRRRLRGLVALFEADLDLALAVLIGDLDLGVA
jgi:hypothetical protein